MDIYISRNFTEFGPFKENEIHDFLKRGIIHKGDFVRHIKDSHWITVEDLTKKKSQPAAKGQPTPKPAGKKAPSKKTSKR